MAHDSAGSSPVTHTTIGRREHVRCDRPVPFWGGGRESAIEDLRLQNVEAIPVGRLVSQLRAQVASELAADDSIGSSPKKKNPGWVCRLGMCAALLTQIVLGTARLRAS
jgi:hypothetical protein